MHFENNKGQRWTTKGTTNANPSTHIQIKYQASTERAIDNILLKPKKRPNVWRAGGWSFGGWIQRADSKDAAKMVEATVQLGGYITKESEEMQIEALKERLRGAKGKCMAKRISFPPAAHENETKTAVPSCHGSMIS